MKQQSVCVVAHCVRWVEVLYFMTWTHRINGVMFSTVDSESNYLSSSTLFSSDLNWDMIQSLLAEGYRLMYI